MSLSSEQDLLYPYLLRDVLEDAIKQMEILLQKYRGDNRLIYYPEYKKPSPKVSQLALF